MSAATAIVDLGAITRNIATIRSMTPAAVMAVVKADAFGHGAVQVARAALGAGASQLGVTSLDEALALREAGIAAPILSWLNGIDAAWDDALRAGIEVAVSSLSQLEGLARTARRAGVLARLHLHADTGMAREGAALHEWPALCARAAQLSREHVITVRGVMGHLPCADAPCASGPMAGVREFETADRIARAAGLCGYARHLAASGAILSAPMAIDNAPIRHPLLSSHYDIVRIGAAMVGIDSHGTGLVEGAMSLSAPVLSVRWADAGTSVGYGHTETLAAGTYLALLPVGYADGVPRSSAGAARVSLGGRVARVVGRVSMDSIVIDAGPTKPPHPGDLATVFGPGHGGEPTVADWASWSGTVPHEIVTGLGPRVQRRYVGTPELAATDGHALVGARP